MPRYTSVVYLGMYFVQTYKQRLISTVCCFLAISAGVAQDISDMFGY